MRASRLQKIVNHYSYFGFWMGLLVLVLPMCWEQDTRLINDGKDIIHFRDKSRCYFRGTLRQRNKWINGQR